jgi:hypothetical protein
MIVRADTVIQSAGAADGGIGDHQHRPFLCSLGSAHYLRRYFLSRLGACLHARGFRPSALNDIPDVGAMAVPPCYRREHDCLSATGA